ncbi:MAG: hypothetical protein ACI38Q_02835 [Candidatus Bruticola sp.]
MNLQALYNLKEQLERLAAAGTSIQDGDFRLQKSVDILAPLAASSPVVAKITDNIKQILNTVPNQRSYIFLDSLALINAVIYTQGSFGCAGEPRKINAEPGKYLELSYSKLKDILEPLNNSGNGRLAQVQEMWQTHPEYFSDYRVINQLIKALDESYADLGTLYVSILYKQIRDGNFSPGILKENFSQVSKRSMMRRLQLLTAYGSESEWLSDLLPQAKKDLREAIITALGGNKDNLPLLLDLLKTEKGKNRQAVLKALAHIDTYETKELWKAELEKNASETICLFEGANTPLVTELTAEFFSKLIGQLQQNNSKELADLFNCCLNSMVGKWSSDIQHAWFQAAEVTQCKSYNEDFTSQLASTLAKSIIINPCRQAQETAHILSEQNKAYFCAFFMTEALTLPSEVLYNKYSDCIVQRNFFFQRENKKQEQLRLQITAALSWIYHNEVQNRDVISYIQTNSLAKIRTEEYRPVDKLDIRWFNLLTDSKVERPNNVLSYFEKTPTVGRMSYSLEQIMAALIDQTDSERCIAIGNFLYKSAQKEQKTWKRERYVNYLRRCGFSESVLEDLIRS